jgi:LysR family glycine cleavage system transcriptional activator
MRSALQRRRFFGQDDDLESGWRLPMLSRIPLEAFRVFEAAARHGNFSAAARELGVTQAAVSRRIRGLEAELGAALFARRGRHVSLTEEGRRLHGRTRAALDYLEEALAPFRPAHRPRAVSLVASGSISHLWLGPRLRAFARERPEVSVRVLTSDAMADLADNRHDLTILYSTGEHPRWRLSPLVAEELVPVAAPAYLAEVGIDAAALPPGGLAPEAIARLDRIEYERFNAHWMALADWFRAAGAEPPRGPPRASFSSYLPAVEAALRGDGVALGSRGLLAGPLAEGRLVALSPRLLSTGFAYCLGIPRARAVPEEAMALHRLLLSAA